jgi:hypothetical protein
MLFSGEAMNDVRLGEIPLGWELQWIEGDDKK